MAARVPFELGLQSKMGEMATAPQTRHLHEVVSPPLQADLQRFVGGESMPASEQETIMRQFWQILGLEVPEHFNNKPAQYNFSDRRMREENRIYYFPAFPNLDAYEEIGRKLGDAFPAQFNPARKPLAIVNGYGPFTKLATHPDAVVTDQDGNNYVYRFTDFNQDLRTLDELLTNLKAHGQAIDDAHGITWISMGRDSVAEAPPGLAIALHFLHHAAGLHLDQANPKECNGSIYQLDSTGQVIPKKLRNVMVFRQSHRGQIKVADVDAMTDSPLKREPLAVNTKTGNELAGYAGTRATSKLTDFGPREQY